MRTLLRSTTLMLLLAVACGDPRPSDSDETDRSALGEDGPPFPLDADLWLAPLETAGDGTLRLGTPSAAVHRPGYDNQPYFDPDGAGFWFTALEEHTGQTDIWRFADGRVEQVTSSVPESEYSALPIPDGSWLSVVRVEADSTQRLWLVPAGGPGGGDPRVLFADLAPVGYHAWLDPDRVAVFVLGDPPTLQVAERATGRVRTVAEGIGRSLRAIPGEAAVSFVLIGTDEPPTLMRIEAGATTATALTPMPAGGDFHAWTPDGTVLMSLGAQVLAWRSGQEEWSVVGDLSELGVRITRLAVSPDGTQIVLVVEPGDITL